MPALKRPHLSPALNQRLSQASGVLSSGYLKLGQTHLQRMLVLSALLHALVLVVKFVPEEVLKRWDKEALMVVLVNSSGDTVPSTAQALANANLLGGGDVDQGMVQSPLPDSGIKQEGDELVALQKQVQALEQQQSALLAAIKGSAAAFAVSGSAKERNPDTGTTHNDSSSTPIMREIAALDKQINDYNSRPKRRQLSPATKEAAFAAYYALWSDRTERLGTQYYPEAARGKSAQVMVTVSVKKDGKLEGLELVKSSGNRAIDQGALLLLKRLAPYPAFTKELNAQVDILDITTRLVFTPANTFTTEVMATTGGTNAPAAANANTAQ